MTFINTFCNVRTKVHTSSQLQYVTQGFGLGPESLQKESKQAFVFVRKVKTENGLTLPFTFVGTGQLLNPRKGATSNGSILYDIHMDNPLPDDLMEDFRWTA